MCEDLGLIPSILDKKTAKNSSWEWSSTVDYLPSKCGRVLSSIPQYTTTTTLTHTQSILVKWHKLKVPEV